MSKLRYNVEGLLEVELGEGRRLTENHNAKTDIDGLTGKQLSSLTDADFPLVCTFHCLLRLIENSVRFVTPLL